MECTPTKESSVDSRNTDKDVLGPFIDKNNSNIDQLKYQGHAESKLFNEENKNNLLNTNGVDQSKKVLPTRQQWARELEFVLACMGYAVGLGNLWRFPYLCYDSGGGAFLIPYFIMLLLCGIPLLYMELAVGQLTRQGPVGAIKKLCPLLQGAGLSTVVLSFLLCTYYNVILSWAMYYMFSGFSKVLPWSHCGNPWNTNDSCWDSATEGYVNNMVTRNSSSLESHFVQKNISGHQTFYGVKPNGSHSPSQEYFERHVLQKSAGIEYQGTIRWELSLLLLLAWVLVYLCLWKGIRITGKVVYFTATFPYLVIIALLIRGVTLPGSRKGIDFFINPRWELLAEPKVWVNAAAQNFNSIGIAFGSMIAFSSYNKRDNPIFRDVMSICTLNSLTSLISGFAIFSILGYIAHTQGQEVHEVVEQGPGLVFMVYPEAFSTMPVSQLFSFLFFFMLFALALDSQFASVEVIITTIEDHWGGFVRRYIGRREVLVAIVCIVSYFLGFPCITNGGIYYFKIIDYYSSGLSLMLVAFVEVIAVAWFYGARRLRDEIAIVTGRTPSVIFMVCWYIVSPLLILAIMMFNWYQYTPVTFGSYQYPDWAVALGWMLASLSFMCIPLGMIKAIYEAKGRNISQKFMNSLKPSNDLNSLTGLARDEGAASSQKAILLSVKYDSQFVPGPNKSTL